MADNPIGLIIIIIRPYIKTVNFGRYVGAIPEEKKSAYIGLLSSLHDNLNPGKYFQMTL